MIMEKLLVVVDMQPGFPASENQELVDDICNLATDYMDSDAFIIVLEFVENPYNLDNSLYGRTLDDIKDHIGDYNRVAYFGKDDNNGADYIQHVLVDVKDRIGLIEVVGINKDACVVQTAVGIAANNPDLQVDILEEYCDSRSREYEIGGDEQVHESTVEQVECYIWHNDNNASNLQLVGTE